jgi:hypothetical protein
MTPIMIIYIYTDGDIHLSNLNFHIDPTNRAMDQRLAVVCRHIELQSAHHIQLVLAFHGKDRI